MAEPKSFWTRVSGVFRSGPPADHRARGESTTSSAAAGAMSPAMPARALAADSEGVPWWRRRQVRQAQAREASLRVAELAGALQEHFRRQDQRAAELSGSLQHIGGVLEQLAESQQSQGECLRNIAENTAAAGKATAALTETMGRVPDSLLTQAEAIRTVARQLEVAQESDTQLMHSLRHFGQAVETLGSSGTAQVEALRHLNASHQEQHEAFTTLVREQARRFLVIVILAAVLAVAAISVLTTIAWRLTS